MVKEEIKNAAVAVGSEVIQKNAKEVGAVGTEIAVELVQPFISVTSGVVAGAGLPVLTAASESVLPVIRIAVPTIAGVFSLLIFSRCAVHLLKDISNGKRLLLEIFRSSSPTPLPSPTPTPSPTPSPLPSPTPTPSPSPSPSPSPFPLASRSSKAPMRKGLPPKLFVVAAITAAGSIWALTKLLKPRSPRSPPTPRTPPTPPTPPTPREIYIVEVKDSFYESFGDESFGGCLPPFTHFGRKFFGEDLVVMSQADRDEKMEMLKKSQYKPDLYVDPNGNDKELYLLTEIFLCTSVSLHLGLAITMEGNKFVLYRTNEPLKGAKPANAAAELERRRPCGRPHHTFLPSEYFK